MKTSISIRIMDSDFQLACETDEKEVLSESAELLNKYLRDFRQKNPNLDVEKVLIMGALRTTCELMTEVKKFSDQSRTANQEIEKGLNQIKSQS